MVKKNTYRIDINGGISKGKPYTYQYGKYQEISLEMGRQKATIKFEMKVLKDIQDFIDMKVYPFKDAYRKAHLLHVLKWDTKMYVKRIDITINDETYTLDSKTPHFPFIYTMLSSKPMGLTDAWKSEAMIKHFLGLSKAKSDTDHRSCAVHAFLAGKSRTYSTDRFLNYWKAMNAYYGDLADRYETAYEKKYGKPSNKYQLKAKDTKSIAAMICSDIKKDCYILKLEMLKDPKEEEKKDKDPEDKEEKKKETFYTNRLLYECIGEDIDDLYDDALANLDNEEREGCPYNSLYKAVRPDKEEESDKAMEPVNIPLFVYLLLVYPYKLRCNYFHGNTVQPVISSYTDPEIFDLNIINRFLERYLTEKIPTMFEDREMDDDTLEDLIRFCDYWKKNK